MTTANKTIKINDVEAAKETGQCGSSDVHLILILYLKEKFLLMPNLFSEY